MVVNCPIEELEEDDADGSRTVGATKGRTQECIGGKLKITHANASDIRNYHKITLPPKFDDDQDRYPNLRRGYSILKTNIIKEK